MASYAVAIRRPSMCALCRYRLMPNRVLRAARASRPAKPTSVEEYLSRLPADQRAALEQVRATIRSIVPEAEEAINYQIPMFRLNGMLVGYGARAGHCALYPMSGQIVAGLARELAAYDTSPGTIRFSPEKPLPAALVKKVVKARLAEKRGSS
jgi:uncharacterized protein YdhG (YjbR/CyaY superfamily)